MGKVLLPGLVALLLSAGIAGAQVVVADDVDVYQADDYGLLEHQFVLSGMVGSNFGRSADDPSLNVGATFDYLRNGIFGVELMAGFAPDFEFDVPVAAGANSRLYNFMANLIAAAPLGNEGSFQPFVSGGIGALRLDMDLDDDLDFGEEGVDDTQFAGNIGGGFMGFVQNWGFRADIRYFTGFEEEGDSDILSLGDTSFWRGTVGLSYRW